MSYPSIPRILNFLARFGPNAVERLALELNQLGRSHTAIARMLGVDRANLTRFVNECFDRRYILKEETREILERLEQIRRTTYEEHRIVEAGLLETLAASQPPNGETPCKIRPLQRTIPRRSSF